MSAPDACYITTPIYYVNDVPHIGHAYTTLACDAIARFMRLDGRRVHFLTGTDEHGQKVEKAAREAGMEPQAFCDMVSQRFRELVEVMDFSPDDFIRTTEERHVRAVQALWTRMAGNGYIYLGKYAGWYSVRDEAYYSESELVDGRAPTGAPVEWVEEPSYFFRLSAFAERLLKFYDENPDFVGPPSRYNEVVSFVKGGLQDLSVSRTTFRWGIPVPGDPDHVIYVWVDALTNYISALGWPDEEGELFRTFWPADVHVIGKDILRFHAVYWPAFLMAAGIEPPKRIFAHGWWTNEGQKISKSLGNVIDPHELVRRYGLDQTRYYLLREVPFGQDGDFRHASMVRRINAELANDYGNLVQRVLAMIRRYLDGEVPDPGELRAEDEALLARAHAALPTMRDHMRVQAVHRALDEVFDVIGEANRYVDATAPWALRKSDPARLKTVLWTLAETIRHIATLTIPFMPRSSHRILDLLAVPHQQRTFAALGPQGRPLAPGTKLPEPSPVFPRYVEEAEG